VLLLVVWIAVAVVAVVVLAGLLYGLAGAFGRLERELQAFEGEVRPELGRLSEGLTRAAALLPGNPQDRATGDRQPSA
jgi:hypothetical protein